MAVYRPQMLSGQEGEKISNFGMKNVEIFDACQRESVLSVVFQLANPITQLENELKENDSHFKTFGKRNKSIKFIFFDQRHCLPATTQIVNKK